MNARPHAESGGNIEHSTSNTQHPMNAGKARHWMVDAGRLGLKVARLFGVPALAGPPNNPRRSPDQLKPGLQAGVHGQRRSVLFFQLLLLGLLGLVIGGCERRPYSSPTALRDTNAYFKALSPAVPATINSSALDQITATLDGSAVVISRPVATGAVEPSDGFEHGLKRLAPGEKLEGKDATFELVALSVSGPGISPAPPNGERYVPVDFFAPDGSLLSKEQLKTLGFRDWHLKEYVGDGRRDYWDSFPELKVWTGSSRRLPGYVRPVGLFDAYTKQSLVSGYSYSQVSSNDHGYVEVRPRAWHATPLDLMLDVELDGKVTIQTNATAGMNVPVPGGIVRLVGIWEGDRSSWSSQSGSGTETIRLTLSESKEKAKGMAVFAVEPTGLAIHYALLNEQGKDFGGGGGGTSGSLRMVGFEGRVQDVKWVRFTVYTNHQRVVLRLPPIPRLPGAKQNYANLFDVPVPLVNFGREYELREFVADLTQMKFSYPSIGDTMPTNLFPMTLTNVTPAEVLALYRRNITNTFTVVVDAQKQEIRVEPTMFEKARRWVMQKLGR
jgi:hypothetical protein